MTPRMRGIYTETRIITEYARSRILLAQLIPDFRRASLAQRVARIVFEMLLYTRELTLKALM